MKKLLLIPFILLSIAGYSQMNTFGGIGLRVNDTTTYQANAVTFHNAGYYDIYFNNQATNDHWDVWNGSSYDHIFAFGQGTGGWPLTGTAALTGNVSITGDFGLNLGTPTNHLDSFSVYTETRMLMHAQDQFAVDVHDDVTSDIVTVDVQPKSLNIQLGDAAQTIFQLNDEDGGNGVTITTTGNDISLTATGAGDINLTGGVAADIVTVNDDAYGVGWNGSVQVPTKNAVYDKIENTNVVGAQDLFISSAAMWPRTTGGCADLSKTEMSTSLFNVQTLDFDQTTQEFAQFQVSLPRNWNNGTITVTVYWTAAVGTGTVQWDVNGGAYSNDDALTVAFGTVVEIDDTLITTNDLHISPTSTAITLAGTPADSDFLALQISRDPSEDTLTGDAKLLGVRVTITLDAGTSE